MTDRDNNDDLTVPKDQKPAKEETCNEYWTRKQMPFENGIVGDGDAEVVRNDDSFAESRNYPNPDKGPMNIRNWGRFGH